jgi:hypothetical protein
LNIDFSSLSSLKNTSISTTKVEQAKEPGPQLAKYDESVDKGMKKFKDGKRLDSNDKICKRRYSLIYVTAMQDVSMTVTDSFLESLYN